MLRVTWLKLDANEARGKISAYRVIYREHGRQAQKYVQVDGDTLEYSIEGEMSCESVSPCIPAQ